MTHPLTTILDLDVVSTRHHPIADPAACGTCWRLALAGKPTEHSECARRATLVPAPNAPDWEAILDIPEDQRAELPARFHTPTWEGNAVPNSWVCAVCWGDGWVTRWPCKPAVKHGAEVFTPEHQAERARDDVPVLLAEVDRLRAELATAKAVGYRQAADNATEQVQLHGKDADAEMLLVFLKRGAELREQFAAQAVR